MSEDIIELAMKNNCVSQGLFQLKNGSQSRFYFNMKNLISHPELLMKCAEEIYKKLPDFDIVCGIPHGAMPIATCISVKYNKPMIFVRDKQKSYGMNKQIEGEYSKESKCVLIDDVLTSGGSLIEAYDILKEQVNIVDSCVVVDRQMHSNIPFKFKSLFTKTDVTTFLLQKYMQEKKSNICFSGDISDPNKLLEILGNVGHKIVACKLHIDIINLDICPDFIEKLMLLANKHNFLLMEDRKFVDISYIVEKQYNHFKNWADLVTVHGSVNSDVISKLSGVILVANMSNNTFNYDEKCINMAKKYDSRIVGFVSQHRLNSNKIHMTPGISHNNGKEGDQNYRTLNNVDTDIAIVGRAIYNSDDPLDSVLKLLSK
jgi:uridine monophosphate synthetase